MPQLTEIVIQPNALFSDSMHCTNTLEFHSFVLTVVTQHKHSVVASTNIKVNRQKFKPVLPDSKHLFHMA